MARTPGDVYGFGNLEITDADIKTAGLHNRDPLSAAIQKMKPDDFSAFYAKNTLLLNKIMSPDSAFSGPRMIWSNLSTASVRDLAAKTLKECKNYALLSDPNLLELLPERKRLTPEKAAMDRMIHEDNKKAGLFGTLAKKLGLKAKETETALPSAPPAAQTDVEEVITKPKISAADALIKVSEPVPPPKPSVTDRLQAVIAKAADNRDKEWANNMSARVDAPLPDDADVLKPKALVLTSAVKAPLDGDDLKRALSSLAREHNAALGFTEVAEEKPKPVSKRDRFPVLRPQEP